MSFQIVEGEVELQTPSKGTTPAGAPTSEGVDDNRQALHVKVVGNAQAGIPDQFVTLMDDSGNVVGVILDGTVYRVQADAKVAKGSSDLVHLDALDTSSGKGRLKATLYSAEGEAVSFSSAPPNPASIYNGFVKNGSNESLLVDGSTTPIVFEYLAHASQDISIQEIKFVLASNSIKFGSGSFGAVAGPLTNGLKIEIVASGNAGTLAIIKQNECFIHFASPGGFQWVVSSKDMMSATYLIGGGLKLVGGSADKVRVTVQDDIDAAGVYLKCFVKGNLLAAS